MHKTR